MISDIGPGDILVTRNTDEVGNESPGFWNHLAIVSVNGWVVEAQVEPDAVIAAPLDNFIERYPEILAFRMVSDTSIMGLADRQRVATQAATFVGLPYRRIASLFPRWRRPGLGENCVSVVRKTLVKAGMKDPGWKKPDHAAALAMNHHAYGVSIVHHKIDYDGWVKPEVWLEGMTKEPGDLCYAAPGSSHFTI